MVEVSSLFARKAVMQTDSAAANRALAQIGLSRETHMLIHVS